MYKNHVTTLNMKITEIVWNYQKNKWKCKYDALNIIFHQKKLVYFLKSRRHEFVGSEITQFRVPIRKIRIFEVLMQKKIIWKTIGERKWRIF